jgi:hypothetical protein
MKYNDFFDKDIHKILGFQRLQRKREANITGIFKNLPVLSALSKIPNNHGGL